MFHIPVPVDPELFLRQLALQERTLLAKLAELEDRIRKFEDFERPAYEAWLRLELGPAMMTLEEILEKIHERRILAQRINELLETQKLNPREALYVATAKKEWSDIDSSEGKPKKPSGWDAEEIDTRRQAKREAKRADRRRGKEKKKDSTSQQAGGSPPISSPNGSSRLVSLYRALARKLHPDSPISIKGLPASRVLALWLEVQAAYNSANMERLLAIAAWLGEGVEEGKVLGMASSVLTFSERFERVRSMVRSCSRLETKLSHLVAHPAWEFETVHGKLRRKLRQRAARELEDETAKTQVVLDALDDFIDSIGTPKPPKPRR
ncbi:MAG: hypothetical protein ABIQ95_05905 [Bdellovibrionia bacterium]